MNNILTRQRLSPVTASVASILAAGLADTAMGQSEAGVLEQIVVTGSRIQQTGMMTGTPVTTLSAAELDMMAPGNLIDALDQLPQLVNNENQNEQSSTGSSSGGTNLDLRGLGINRTLTLVNGRRLTPNSKLGTVNIDVLPSAIIERFEVVTGGASAAYGSDAVAGVVNAILDTDFTGFRGNAQVGESSRGDLENRGLEVVYGTPIGERMHLVVSGEFYGQKPGTFDDREWFLQGYSAMTNPEFLATGQGPQLITVPNVVGTDYTCGGLISAPNSSIHRMEFNADGSVSPFIESSLSVVGTGTNSQSIAPQFGGGSGCNPATFTGNLADGPGAGNRIDRTSLFSYFDFDLSDNVTLFNQTMYSKVETEITNVSGVLRSSWRGTIFRENPFLPEEIRSVMEQEGLESFDFQRDNSELQARGRELFGDNVGRVDPENETLSITVGAEVDLQTNGFFDGWQLNAHYTHGRNKQAIHQLGYFRIQTLPLAMDAVRHPQTDEIVCRVQTVDVDVSGWGNQNLIDDCVPLNLFGDGNASPEAISYVLTPFNKGDALAARHELTQRDAEFVLSGEIADGWGAGPILGAFGASYRKQEVTSEETPAFLAMQSTPSNDIEGIRGVPPGYAGDADIHQFDSFTDLEGSYDVTELFAEGIVPVGPVTVNAAIRWADYSGSGVQDAYKLGLDWPINDAVRLRGTVSRDVRAATLEERFDTDRGAGTVLDPLTGVSNTFSLTQGGNPSVDPEEADTLTFGVVLRPSRVQGLSLAVDWWDIDVSGAIGTLGAQRIVDDCFAGASSLCARITRDPNTQVIVDLDDTFININKEKVSGLDVEALYTAGRWGFRGLVSYIDERTTEIPGAPPDDQAGDIRDGVPEWQANLAVTYANGPFSGSLQQFVIGDGKIDTRWTEGVHIDENDVDAFHMTNLRLSYSFDTSAGATFEVYGNILNLFDEDPPLAVGRWSVLGGSSQTNTGLYDVRGRRYAIGLRFQL